MLLRLLSLTLGVCFQFVFSLSWGQSPYQTDGTGSIHIISDASVQRAISKITEGEIRQKGFRVQIVAESGTGSKDRALKARNDFQQKFPGIPSYITYEAPNFKVRAGDFLTFLEAAALCEKVRVFYPTAYVVEDQIWIVSPRRQRE